MRSRSLVGAIAAIVFVVGVATAAYLLTTYQAATARHCEVNAQLTTEGTSGAALDGAIVDRYPALREALAEARSAAIGTARLGSCDERDRLVSDLEAMGATDSVRENTYPLRYDGRAYEVEVVKIVA